MDWTGPNKKKLRKALIDIYNSPKKLAKFVNDEFDVRLDTITNDSNIDDRCYDLIEEADSQRWIDKLYENFCEINKDNLRTRELIKELGDMSRLLALIPSTQTIEGVRPNNEVIRQPSELIPPIETSGTGNLVIAIFWTEKTAHKFRIQPKFCLTEPKTNQIIQEPLTEENTFKENDSVDSKKIPDLIQKNISFAIKKLDEYFPDPIKPWKLVISLFVPVDLLSFPLSYWCGKDNDRSLEYPIVLGCSDRFDPSRSQDAAGMRNNLKKGWQRLQKDLSQSQFKLHGISWLNSDQASTCTLKSYSGFQCYGNWLKSGKEYLTNWQELIKSGIPLALWMEKGELEREKIKDNFYKLTDYHHLNFLEYIPDHRDEQWKTYEDYVGIFYEDPNYVPDFPRSEVEQFFAWPDT